MCNSEEVPKHLVALSLRSRTLADNIRRNLKRTDHTIAAANFCTYISGQLQQLSVYYPDNVSGLAWVARNLFELNLTVRHVISSDDAFQLWLGQAINDEKEFIEGVISVSQDQSASQNYKELVDRLEQLSEIGERHNLELSRPFQLKIIANEYGMLDEYFGLYKLLSKYIHPSSLLINKWYEEEADTGWLNIFIVKSQLYAGDSVQRIANACGVKL